MFTRFFIPDTGSVFCYFRPEGSLANRDELEILSDSNISFC